MIINAAVVDDEASSAQLLTNLLAEWALKSGHQIQVFTYPSAEAFLAERSTLFDWLFLDISMGGMNGIEAAKAIRKENKSILIIFVTSLASYATQGYVVQAFDYLLKPITMARLSLCLEQATLNLGRNRGVDLSLSSATGPVYINSADLAYVESFGHNLIYHLAQQTVSTWGSLKATEKNLADAGFFRSSNSYLVNLKYVQSLSKNSVSVASVKLPLSRGRRRAFLEKLNAYRSR